MKLLRHKLTGVEGMYPEHFANFDYFEEVTPVKVEEVVTLEEPVKELPSKKNRSRRKI